MIDAPRYPASHPDRGVHAEEALEAAFSDLAGKAEARGWSTDEAAFALLNLATARILALDANRSTEDELG